MTNILRILFLGIAIGALFAALLAQDERKRLRAALAAAEKTASERAILPDDLDERIARSKQVLAQSRWEDDAIGRLPNSWREDNDE